MNKLQSSRSHSECKCKICGKVIRGEINTMHLGVLSHIRMELRKGLRPKSKL